MTFTSIRSLGFALPLVLTSFVVGCSGGSRASDDATTSSDVSEGALTTANADANVTLRDYLPESVSITIGQTIQFTNSSGDIRELVIKNNHKVTVVDRTIGDGSSIRLTFAKEGGYFMNTDNVRGVSEIIVNPKGGCEEAELPGAGFTRTASGDPCAPKQTSGSSGCSGSNGSGEADLPGGGFTRFCDPNDNANLPGGGFTR